MLRNSSLQDILREYRDGKREFAGIRCSGADFHGLDVSGSDFSGSDLSYSDFDGSNLSGCNFSRCNMEWSSFRRTNLAKAIFEKANLTYCDFSNAIFENASLRDADLSWSIAFNTNMQSADMKGASIATVAFDASQLSTEGLERVQKVLRGLKSQLPYELHLILRFAVSAMHEKQQLDVETGERKSGYATFSVGSGYNASISTESGISYSTANPYVSLSPYHADRRKKTRTHN